MAIPPSSSAPARAVSPVGRSRKIAQEGREHQDAQEAQHHRGQAAQQFHQRLEDLAHPARGDLGDEDGRPDPEGHGDQHGAHGDDQRTGDERQDAEIALDRVPAAAEQVAERDFDQGRQAFAQQEEEDQRDKDDGRIAAGFDEPRDDEFLPVEFSDFMVVPMGL